MPHRSKEMKCFCGRTVHDGERCPCETPPETPPRHVYSYLNYYEDGDMDMDNPLYWEAAAFHDDCGDR